MRILPGLAVLSAVLVTLARIDATVALIAALAGTLMLTAFPWERSRSLLIFAVVPVAAWIAQQPPWGGIAQAVIVAGALVPLLTSSPIDRTAWPAWLAGGASAVAVGLIAGQTGLMPSASAGLGIVIVLAAFRMAALHVGKEHGLYAGGMALSSMPHLGAPGLLLAGVEAIAVLTIWSLPHERRGVFALTAPLALVGLL